MNYRPYATTMASAVMAATVLISPLAPAACQTTRSITLDAGTVIPVKLRDTLSSTGSHTGERFTAVLQSEESARSLRLPVGTYIEGTVAAVRPMQGTDPGVIALNFDRVVLPNESTYAIKGSLIGLDDKSVTRASNGRLTAKPDQKNKTLIYAGYGAGAGLLLGALTKGNTILDTLIGGGLGYLLGTLDKSHGTPRDVVLKPETELGVRLDRAVTVRQYDDGTDNSYYGSDPNRRSRTERYGDSQRNDRSRTDRYDDPLRNDRSRTDRNGDPLRNDTDRDPYDDQARNHRSTTGADSYQVLNQFPNVRDNGQTIRVMAGGRQLSFLPSARPFISGGTVMVPLIPVLKAERVRYSYTPTQLTVEGIGETYTGTFDSRYATAAGNRRITLPTAIQRRNGTIYAPMQFLALVTDQRLTFDRETQTVEFGDERDTDTRP